MAYWEEHIKLLYVIEYGALLEAVYDISGLDKDINEDIIEGQKLIKQG